MPAYILFGVVVPERADLSIRNARRSLEDRSKQWEKLREVTALSREDIEFIKRFADPIRHGDAATWDTPEIEKAERLTWTAIHAAVLHFRDRGYQ